MISARDTTENKTDKYCVFRKLCFVHVVVDTGKIGRWGYGFSLTISKSDFRSLETTRVDTGFNTCGISIYMNNNSVCCSSYSPTVILEICHTRSKRRIPNYF